jgi:branched-chain amino acid transport system ATP-binding protein
MTEIMLQVGGVEAGYGRVKVLHGVGLDVMRGEIVALIGANGAGKTTLLKVIAGALPVSAGSIAFQDEDISRLPTHKRVARGLLLTQEGRGILGNLTVRENLLMGAYSRPRSEIAESLDLVHTMFPVLEMRAKQAGGTLSGGEQQMLALGRTMMARPSLYMLDEPSLGLAPKIVNEVFLKIRELRNVNVGILLVEQNARKALQIADRGYVMEVGRITFSGSAEELRDNDRIRAAYLGSDRRAAMRPPADGVQVRA